MSAILITLLIAVIILALVWKFAKGLLWLAINSVIGVFALMGWNLLFPPVVINFWSAALVILFGIFGLIAVVLLSYFGIAF